MHAEEQQEGTRSFMHSFLHLNLCHPQRSHQEQILTPRHRRSYLFYYSSHKNFMFLWKYFTTMTENIITDSGRLTLAETWEFSQNWRTSPLLHPVQGMTSSLILLYLHTNSWVTNRMYCAQYHCAYHFSFSDDTDEWFVNVKKPIKWNNKELLGFFATLSGSN